MKLQEIYLKDITRKVNPAVSATMLDKDVVRVEIEEYVFTLDILINLYEVLSNIMENSYTYSGIWISGYYGSGKSHFLKYLDYCMNPEYREKALSCFVEEASKYDAIDNDNVDWMPEDLTNLSNWFNNRAQFEIVMFNIGSSYNHKEHGPSSVTEVLWKEFNAMRGYNKFNIPLAQYLEKYLDERGKLEEFKRRFVDELGYDWESNFIELGTTEIDTLLNLARDICPSYSVDSVRNAIENQKIDLSVDNFSKEVLQYVRSKNNSNFRLMFFIDEISQYINGDGRLLLQLQSVVEELHNKCGDQVWVACTAQQDLSEILDMCKIMSANEDHGKIMGRFEVRPSLQGTKSEYITQKRILAKKPEAETELARFYDNSVNGIDTQFQLPNTYEGYKDKNDFINYYPFVPYQLQLINRVFSNFEALGYVNKEVKDNERSLIRITHNLAKEDSMREAEIGTFVSFDQFFNKMFRESLLNSGQNARKNAERAANMYQQDVQFANRVANILFMICNMSDQDKQQFPATIDNIVTLLMRDINTPKTTIKDNVRRVIEHLIENSVIREVNPQRGAEYYEFFTAEETQVSVLIKNQQVDNASMAEQLASMVTNYYSPRNKESIGDSSVAVSASTSGKRMFGTTGNTDIEVEFVVNTPETDVNLFAFNNLNNKLVFFLTKLYSEDKRFKDQFYHFCQVAKMSKDQNLSAEKRKILEIFEKREQRIFDNDIKRRFEEMLDKCPVISGHRILEKAEIGDIKGRSRYNKAVSVHIRSVFHMANLVEGSSLAHNSQELRSHIKRPLDANEYACKPMSDAEDNVKNFILRGGRDVTIDEIVTTYQKAPYGWSEYATIDIVNELYRRNIFTYSYNNNPNISINEIADRILNDKKRITLELAQEVSPELIKNFKKAWQHVFNQPQTPANDAREIFRLCHDDPNGNLGSLLRNYNDLRNGIAKYPFVEDINRMLDFFNGWKEIREQATFFETVIKQQDEAAKLFDRGKQILEFKRDHLESYRDILQFVNSNQSNFELLDENAKDDIDQLNAIITDAEVFTHFQDYVRLKNALRSRLGAKREELQALVREAYKMLYDNIRSIAADKEVSTGFLPDLENELFKIKQSNMSLYQLRDKADTGDLYATYVNRINMELAKRQSQPQPQPGPNPTPQPQPQPQAKQINVITLDTSISTPLKTEGDVDLYLASLKEELMKHINNNEEILIKQ